MRRCRSRGRDRLPPRGRRGFEIASRTDIGGTSKLIPASMMLSAQSRGDLESSMGAGMPSIATCGSPVGVTSGQNPRQRRSGLQATTDSSFSYWLRFTASRVSFSFCPGFPCWPSLVAVLSTMDWGCGMVVTDVQKSVRFDI